MTEIIYLYIRISPKAHRNFVFLYILSYFLTIVLRQQLTQRCLICVYQAAGRGKEGGGGYTVKRPTIAHMETDGAPRSDSLGLYSHTSRRSGRNHTV